MADSVEAIMEATYQVLGRDGYADTKIRKIAAEFDGSQSLIYYHYDGKHELLVAFLDYLLSGFDEELDTIRAMAPDAHLRAVVDLLLPTPDEDIAFQQALIEMRVQSPYDESFAGRFDRLDDRLTAVIRADIVAGCESGVFSGVDPDRAARQLLNEIYGIHYRHVPMSDRAAIEQGRTRLHHEIDAWIEE
jgi:AcrR family transcriptional regulator